MSAATEALLANLAMAQAAWIAPALGDSYAAKSAATMAGILMMLAEDMRGRAEREAAAAEALQHLMAGATIGDPALAAEIRGALEERGGPAARLARLLPLFVRLHGWADCHHPALAGRCRDLLVELTGREVLSPPALPGA